MERRASEKAEGARRRRSTSREAPPPAQRTKGTMPYGRPPPRRRRRAGVGRRPPPIKARRGRPASCAIPLRPAASAATSKARRGRGGVLDRMARARRPSGAAASEPRAPRARRSAKTAGRTPSGLPRAPGSTLAPGREKDCREASNDVRGTGPRGGTACDCCRPAGSPGSRYCTPASSRPRPAPGASSRPLRARSRAPRARLPEVRSAPIRAAESDRAGGRFGPAGGGERPAPATGPGGPRASGSETSGGRETGACPGGASVAGDLPLRTANLVRPCASFQAKVGRGRPSAVVIRIPLIYCPVNPAGTQFLALAICGENPGIYAKPGPRRGPPTGDARWPEREPPFAQAFRLIVSPRCPAMIRDRACSSPLGVTLSAGGDRLPPDRLPLGAALAAGELCPRAAARSSWRVNALMGPPPVGGRGFRWDSSSSCRAPARSARWACCSRRRR